MNKFEQAGMLHSALEGNKKVFRVNTKHPLFEELQTIVMKYVGLDRILEDVVKQLGEVIRVFILGDYARGMDSGIIDLALIGKVDEIYLIELVRKAEGLIGRKVRYLIFEDVSSFDEMNTSAALLLWDKNGQQ